ncbi:hypothetical protein SAMN02910447_00476 [Ruminococcus sp. YE71]|uniref:hypothetical protein n=1 Tax=unclassified Ruminococcus TaxID=2608920 RepID=UPI000888AFEE|nr:MULTISPECIES: hypothetical protein [unclassified Ruminococcus]SDA11787.1 hypothetical protein SAMN02910446_00475 [Ruminococcus sp. YE78]SFW15744.1 hypothetical protein SAMN02910447_00476 [Ruminococcus sp. YE71]
MITRDISREQHIGYSGTSPVARLTLYSDTSAELGGVTAVDGVNAAQGSIAIAVQEGEVLMLDSTGTWYKQSDGSAVEAPESENEAENND